MQLPIDIKAVFNEAMDIEAARKTPLSVSIYIDETSPGDVQALVRHAFSSSSPYAQVSMIYFPQFAFEINPHADIAIIVAGVDEKIGEYAYQTRAAGIPVMVVTSLPVMAYEISKESGFPLLRDDLIGPIEKPRRNALPSKAQVEAEPYKLCDEKTQYMLHQMGEWIIQTNNDKRLAFALTFPFMRRTLSLESVDATAAQNAGVGLFAFIPGADMPIMTLNQAKMLLQIAAVYGQPLNMERVKELAVLVGGAFTLRTVARQVVAFVPALGWAVKAVIGYSGTQAMGRAAVEYFEGGGNMSGLAEIVGKVHKKALETAESVKEKPKVEAAIKSMGSKVSSAASNVVGTVVPMASSVVDSTIDMAAEAGVVSESAQTSTKRVTHLLTSCIKKEKS